MKRTMLVQENSRRIRLTNLDKIMFPGRNYTKAHFLRYLAEIAPVMLYHLEDRPLVMTRYPDGVGGKSFYQKNLPRGLLPGAEVFPFTHSAGSSPTHYLVARERVDLLWLGNMASLEIHAWQSRTLSPQRPDYAVFDLDPAPPAAFDQARQGAFYLRLLLEEMNLVGYPKTSGGQGLHVYVPLEPVHTFRQVSEWVRQVGLSLVDRHPGFFTLERARARRQGVYVDYLQNGLGRTMVAPYSTRPRPEAPVSTPVTWEELEEITPQQLTLDTVPRLVSERGDPFRPVTRGGQILTVPGSEDSPPGPGPGP